MNEQFTLGDLIRALEKIEDKSKEIMFDFDYFRPDFFCSWRGDYSMCCLTFHDRFEPCTVEELLSKTKEAVGSMFTGWKGGEYMIYLETPLWVSRPEHGAYTGIHSILDEGYRCIIETKYFNYHDRF